MNECQTAQLLATVFEVSLIVSGLSFFGWRRAHGHWRTVLFIVFALCALIVLDFFILAVVYSFLPPPPKPTVCKP